MYLQGKEKTAAKQVAYKSGRGGKLRTHVTTIFCFLASASWGLVGSGAIAVLKGKFFLLKFLGKPSTLALLPLVEQVSAVHQVLALAKQLRDIHCLSSPLVGANLKETYIDRKTYSKIV